MLITSNTIVPILDGNGKPLVNGRLYVRRNSSEESGYVQLTRSPGDSGYNAPNPIILNSAGAIPFPVYTSAKSAWCFAYDQDGVFILSYPLNGNPEDDVVEEQQKISDEVVKNLEVQKDGVIRNDLIVEGNTELKGELIVEKDMTLKNNLISGKKIKSFDAEIKFATMHYIETNHIHFEDSEVSLNKYFPFATAFLKVEPGHGYGYDPSLVPIGSYITLINASPNIKINQIVSAKKTTDIDIDLVETVSDSAAKYRVVSRTGGNSSWSWYLCVRIS